MQQYQIRKSIGNGSYGQVFLARHIYQNYQYAVKRVRFKDIEESMQINIKNEVRVLQAMQHPNLVPYKQSIMDSQGNFNIVISYCEGGHLQQKIKSYGGKNIPEQEVIEWLSQISLALYYMHNKRILHRDLKPQNIFFKNRRVLLGDFGISKILDEISDLASTCIGTPYYMSPDLYKYKKYSYKADIWALGCVTYEICNQRRPFQANNYNALAIKIIKGSYPPVSSFYSKQLRELIGSMLSMDSKCRPSVVQILSKPFIKQRVINYVTSLFKQVQSGQISNQIFLNQLVIQVQKLGYWNDVKRNIGTLSQDKDQSLTRITSTPSLKSKLPDKENKRLARKEEHTERKSSLQKQIKIDSVRRQNRKSVHESSSKRESSQSQDKKQVQRQSIERNREQSQETEEEYSDTREKVLREKQRKERQKLQSYQKELKQISKANLKDRQSAIEKQRIQYMQSHLATFDQSKRLVCIQEERPMEEEDYDDQNDQHLIQIAQQDDQQHEMSVAQLKQVSKPELQEDVKINPQWLKITDRVKLLQHRCQILNPELVERVKEVIQRSGEQQDLRKSMLQLLGEQNVGYWHVIDQLVFYEGMAKSVTRAV